MSIHHLTHGKTVDILEFVHFNEFDDSKEIIKDLERFKIVLDSEIYREILENALCAFNKGRPRFDVVLMFKIVVLQVLYNHSDNNIVKWIKTSPLKWFLDYPEKFPSKSAFWEFKENLNDSNIINKTLVKTSTTIELLWIWIRYRNY